MEYFIQVKEEGKVIYPISLTNNFEELYNLLNNLNADKKKVCIVLDSNVGKLYTDDICNAISKSVKEVHTFSFLSGEKQKNLDTVYCLYEKLIELKFDRKDILIALGEGVVGDLTGFAAATYLRGISFIQIPTSLLAMVDSSIGGKTGVDFLGYKNMVGAFHQPVAVHINTNTLKSLPKEHFNNGMAEIIKHGLIKDLDYFKWLECNKDSINSFNLDIINEMIYKSCIIKKEVVENDPKEQGERALLNFGHTIGHAIEKAMDFELLHGECVALGMVSAAYISLNRAYITKKDFDYIIRILKDFNLKVNLSSSLLNVDSLLEIIKHDKKQESGKLKFILLKEIGHAYIETSVTTSEITSAIKYILK
ncbi:MAG: 3-dehydroquinate synthase [Clostridiales bacterium]|nr:3-dehydroquinate synthase [Clostridiales bacterium]